MLVDQAYDKSQAIAACFGSKKMVPAYTANRLQKWLIEEIVQDGRSCVFEAIALDTRNGFQLQEGNELNKHCMMC